MRKLLTIILILVASTSHAMSLKQAQGVYYKLAKVNRINAPPLVIWNDPSDNAKSGRNATYVTPGMLSFARNNDEIAIILGHELSHFVNRDNGSTPSREYRADQQGVVMAHRAGYNVCSGVAIVKRFNDKASKTHPSSLDRWNKLKCK